jgi:hypothetical protein
MGLDQRVCAHLGVVLDHDDLRAALGCLRGDGGERDREANAAAAGGVTRRLPRTAEFSAYGCWVRGRCALGWPGRPAPGCACAGAIRVLVRRHRSL